MYMTEREYRQLPYDSYSTLKDFSEDRKKYYKKYILEELENDEDESQENRASLIGSLVDCELLTPHLFNDKYHISSVIKPPTGLMLKFVNELYIKTIANCDHEGKLTKPFELLLKDAYDAVKFDENGNIVAFSKLSFEKVVTKFTGSEVQKYYDELIAIRPTKKILITTNDITLSQRVIQALKTTPATSHPINIVTNDRFTVYNQLMITGFELFGLQFKAMLDRVVVDHLDKIIQPYDIKVTWNVDSFVDNYYLYRKTYLQAAVYHIALGYYFADLIKEGYSLNPIKFIVADSLTYMKPLLYELDYKDLQAGLDGFTYNNRYYKGVKELINELKWHKENEIWTMSKQNYEQEGISFLNIKYD